jgi:hypothetical protein
MRGDNAARGRRDDRGPRERGPRPVDIDRPFDQGVAKVRQAQGVLEAARRGTRLQAIAQAAALFARIASGASAKSEDDWTALGLDEADRRRLQPRWQAAAAQDDATLAGNDAAIDAWLVDAELDAGLDSPAAAQALRRQHQMQRLAVRLQGAAAAAADPRERLLQLAALPSPSANGQADREARLQRVLAAWSR